MFRALALLRLFCTCIDLLKFFVKCTPPGPVDNAALLYVFPRISCWYELVSCLCIAVFTCWGA